MSRSELAVLSCLRDSAQLSTLPAWCRGELSTAADLIDQLRQRLTEIEVECREAWKQAAYWRPRAEQAEAKLALAERENVQLRVAISEATGLLRGFIKIAEGHDAAIDVSGHESLPPHKEGG